MDKVGKYEIVEELLTTGFSDIYIGKDPGTNAYVAVKIFHPKGNNTGENAKYGDAFWRQRFVEESRLLAMFDHPSIIKALDTDVTPEGMPYFVMPFMEANLLYEIGEDADIPEELARLIDTCLNKKRSDRPADAGVVLGMLDRCVPDISILPDKSKIPRRSAHVLGISNIKA